jgi:hypothetical protein
MQKRSPPSLPSMRHACMPSHRWPLPRLLPLPLPARRFGGPIWWNTPLDEDGTGVEENRTTWGQQRGGEEDNDGGGAGPSHGRKRPAEDDDEDELPEAVRARLDALKQGNRTLD